MAVAQVESLTQRLGLGRKASQPVAALLMLPLALAATLSQADYQAGKADMSAFYRIAKSACKSLAENARDIGHEDTNANRAAAADERRLRSVTINSALRRGRGAL